MTGAIQKSKRNDAGENTRPPAVPTPLVGPAIGLMTGIATTEGLGGALLPVSAILAVTAGLVVLMVLLPARWRFARQVRIAALLAVAFLVGAGRQELALTRGPDHVSHVLGDEPVLTRVVGRIVTSPVERPAVRVNPFIPFDPSPRTQFVLELEAFEPAESVRRATGAIRVNVDADELHLRPGKRVRLDGWLYAPRGPRNPGETDWSRWYRYQGIAAGLNVPSAANVVSVDDDPPPGQRMVRWLRARARALLYEPYADVQADEATELLDVMVLGQRGRASRQLNETFLRVGGMHFLAVSGFHVGLLAGVVWWSLRRLLHRGRRVAALVTIVVTVSYALIAEPNAPVQRASIVIVCVAVATLLNRPVAFYNWLALAAIAVLLVNPPELFRAGFQLSFGVVLGLALLVPRIYAPLPATLRFVRVEPLEDRAVPREAGTLRELVLLSSGRWLVALVLVSVVAYVVASPLVMFHFGRVSLLGWLGAIVLAPLVVVTLVLSLATVVLGVIPPLGGAMSVLLHAIADLLLSTANWFARIPWAVVHVSPPPWWLVVGTYALLLWIGWRGRAPRPDRHLSAFQRAPLVTGWTLRRVGLTAVVALCWIGHFVLPSGAATDAWTLRVLAVGDGCVTLFTTPARRTLLYDVGTIHNFDAGATATGAMRSLGLRRLHAGVISHANFDHFSGLETVLETMPTEAWYTSPYFLSRGVLEGSAGKLVRSLPDWTPTVLLAGDRLDFDGATIEVLWPRRGLDEAWEANDRALVLRISVGGRSLLLTGDIEAPAMSALLESAARGECDLHADVLLAPHHGAVIPGVTERFIAAVQPAVIVVSAKRQRERFDELVIRTLGEDAQVLTTGVAGAVAVRVSPDGGLAAETPFAAQ